MQISDDTKTEKRADGNGKARKLCFINDAYNDEDACFMNPKENTYRDRPKLKNMGGAYGSEV